MNDIVSLYGVAMTRFGSIQGFATAIGWKRNKAMRILRGFQEPTAPEICSMTEVLEIPSEQAFMQIFFAQLSTKWTKDRPA